MRKKRSAEEPENLERWLVSYADFITLLFAFFVVMYALSSINEGKYRVLADSLSSAFRMSAKAGGVMLLTEGAPPLPVPVAKPDKGVKDAAEEARGQRRAKMRNMAQEIMAALSPLVKQGKVRVLETSRGITVEINDSVLFTSGEARLEDQSIDALWAVGQVLANYAFPVTIEGHTDDVPIKTERFPSNWELSAVRATSVLRLFAAAGVPAAHLTAIGYGQERPEASNATPEGRAKNRRVSILIDSAEPEAPPHVLSELTAKP